MHISHKFYLYLIKVCWIVPLTQLAQVDDMQIIPNRCEVAKWSPVFAPLLIIKYHKCYSDYLFLQMKYHNILFSCPILVWFLTNTFKSIKQSFSMLPKINRDAFDSQNSAEVLYHQKSFQIFVFMV